MFYHPIHAVLPLNSEKNLVCQRDGLKPLEWVWGGKQERRRPPGKDGGQSITERQDTRSLYNYETKKNIEKRKKGGN